MRSRIFTGIILTGLIWAGLVFWTQETPADETPRLTHHDLVEMSQLGLGVEALVSALEHYDLDLDASPHSLAQLRSQGVPTPVIETIREIAARVARESTRSGT